MKALVVTPFSPVEVNAGHRVRLAQVNQFLKSFCREIDCVFMPFEGANRWRVDTSEIEAVQKAFTRTFILPASSAGRPPSDGNQHHLDEWFDPLFQTFFETLAHRASYNLIVVHNVWLSKCFSYFPPAALKWLELHDVFHLRGEAFARIGVRPDFFAPSKDAELFGIKRADLAVTIGAEENNYVRRAIAGSKTQVLCLACDPVPDSEVGHDLSHTKYLHPDKVVFGMLGSSHPFNVDGATRLMNALRKSVGDTFAPVEVLMAGQLSRTVGSDPRFTGIAKSMGYVEDINDFYNAVDYVIVPVFDGSGVNIKLTEAIRRGAPVIASSTVLRQAGLAGHKGFADPQAMADELCRIAFQRPSKLPFLLQSRREGQKLVEERHDQERRLLSAITKRRHALLVRTSDITDPHLELFCFLAYVSLARSYQGLMDFVAVVSDTLKVQLERLRPVLPNYFAVWPNGDASASKLRRTLELDPLSLVAADDRIAEFFGAMEQNVPTVSLRRKLETAVHVAESAPPEWKTLAFFGPLFADNVSWDPAIPTIAKDAAGSLPPLSARFYCIGDEESDFYRFCGDYARYVLRRQSHGNIAFVPNKEVPQKAVALILAGLASGYAKTQIVALNDWEMVDCAFGRGTSLQRYLPVAQISRIGEFSAVVDKCRW